MIAFCVPCYSCATHLTPTATSHRRRLYWVAPSRLNFVRQQTRKFSNPHIRLLWHQAWAAKENALRTQMSRTTESLRAHSRPLRPLVLGETVFLQNQQGPSPHKWDRSGVVVESLGHDQYRVRLCATSNSFTAKLQPPPMPGSSQLPCCRHPRPWTASPCLSTRGR